MSTDKMSPLSVVLGVVALLVTLAAPATATFPGKNGRIAFIQGPDVWTMNPDGTDVKQLTDLGPSNTSAFWENWSPDGQQLVFTEFPPNAAAEIWMMNADGNKNNQHLVLSEASYNEFSPSFSPDGSDVIFTRCGTAANGTCPIYRVRTDGTGLAAITEPEFPLVDFEAAYSPDGRTIAFQSFDRGGILGAIYLVDADGSNLRRLTPPAPGAVSSNWSPDGEKLIFQTHCCNPQNSEIWEINAHGGRIMQLTDANRDTMEDWNPSWSPQGDAIAFQRFDPSTGTSAIFVMNADRSELHRMLTLPRSEPKKVEPLIRARNPMKRALKQVEQGGGYPRWGPASQ